VAWIESMPDTLRDGALVGALVGLSCGFCPVALGCVECGFLFIGGGIAVGAGLDSAVKGRYVVYGKPPGVSFLRRPAPVSSLGGGAMFPAIRCGSA